MKMTLVLVAAAMAEPCRFKTQRPAPYSTMGDADHTSPPQSPQRSRSGFSVSGYIYSNTEYTTDLSSRDAEELDSAIDDPSTAHSNNDRLPGDVLIDIMRAWRAEDPHNPLVPFYALQVCGSWREAAKATHSLWQHPEFRFRKMLDNAAWIEYHACFARYGGVQGFSINLYNDVGSVHPANPVWAHFCTNILDKARRIDLEISSPGGDHYILAGRTFSLLRALRIVFTIPDAEYPDIKLFMRAPRLRHMELENTYMEFEDLADRETNPLWSLTSLSVTRHQYSAANLFGLARVCIAVRELTVTMETLYDWPSEPVVWNSLQALSVSVETIFDGDKILSRGLSLPNLVTLEVTDNKYSWSFWRRFIELSCPALTRLSVCRNHVDHGKPFIDEMGGLSQIRELVFRDGSLNQDIVALLVMADPGQPMPFPDLQSVHFENAVRLRGFEYSLIHVALQHRYAYLRGRSMPGPFVITCKLLREGDDEENERRQSGESSMAEYNEEERKTFLSQGL